MQEKVAESLCTHVGDGEQKAAHVSSPLESRAEPQPKSNLVHFSLKNVTSGGNNFSNFPENQLTKFFSL